MRGRKYFVTNKNQQDSKISKYMLKHKTRYTRWISKDRRAGTHQWDSL